MFVKKQQDGQSIIDGALKVFSDTKKELEQGIQMCDQEEATLDSQIHDLNMKKASILNSKARAKNVCEKIEMMLK